MKKLLLLPGLLVLLLILGLAQSAGATPVNGPPTADYPTDCPVHSFPDGSSAGGYFCRAQPGAVDERAQAEHDSFVGLAQIIGAFLVLFAVVGGLGYWFLYRPLMDRGEDESLVPPPIPVASYERRTVSRYPTTGEFSFQPDGTYHSLPRGTK